MRNWLLLITALLFFGLYCKSVLPLGQPQLTGITIPDTDGDLLVSLSVARGERLYQDFSILYPPGRFFLQALALRLFDFSFPVIGILHIAAAVLVFPIMLFFLTYLLIEHTAQKVLTSKWLVVTLSYALAIFASTIYLALIHAAQEVHIVLALFFILLLSTWLQMRYRALVAGVLYGLILLFRVDAGIILTLGIATTYFAQSQKVKTQLRTISKYFASGILLVWLPTIIAITLHGSLFNFLYDTVILGLLVQPKFMSLPLPLNDVRLIFMATVIFLFGGATALFAAQQQKSTQQLDLPKLGVQIFAVTAVLSFVSALGRSDEPHLWYGLVWLPALVAYLAFQVAWFIWETFKNSSKITTKKLLRTGLLFFVACLFLYGYGSWQLALKSPSIFLVSSCVLLFLIGRYFPKKNLLLVASAVTALFVFHSYSYLKLRWHLPRPTYAKVVDSDWITHQEDEFYGLEVVTSTQNDIEKVKQLLPSNQQYLFIFPKNILLTEQLGFEQPTRHIIMMNERTEHTEQEIIRELINTNTQYFLIFTEDAVVRGDTVWEWIQAETELVTTSSIDTQPVELRKRK